MFQLPYSNLLTSSDIGHLNRMFDNTSECYKLFWFQAILTKVRESGNEEKLEITFEDLIDEMIADSWYMVSEYHLNLGPRDTLEMAVNHIHRITGMKSSEKKAVILEYLHGCQDKEVLRYKKTLTLNVPFRLQAPFMPLMRGKASWDVKPAELSRRINACEHLIYYFAEYQGLSTVIRIQPEWLEYLRVNHEVLRGWVRYHLILYLQRRNPNVPGISDKLEPPQERKLEKVKKYWRTVSELAPVYEIYDHQMITRANMSIDHFVPWSYVAHDEFWNLHPTTKSINSSKSNNLPNWEEYFQRLSRQEYMAYQLMWQSDRVKMEFDKCAGAHLNSDEVRYRLYREGLSRGEFYGALEEVLYPVYCSAKNSGFEDWIYSGLS